MTEPNTLDEQIDEILTRLFLDLGGDHNFNVLFNDEKETAKEKLKTLFTEHSKEVETEIFEDVITFGNHIIPKDWEKIENVYIWFEAFHKDVKWRGIPGYVYKKPDGSFIAPFRGELLEVIHDTKNEYREIAQLKRNKGE